MDIGLINAYLRYNLGRSGAEGDMRWLDAFVEGLLFHSFVSPISLYQYTSVV